MFETIEKSVKDPGWWFTVIFAGLIVGLFANFLKDWISRLLAHLSAYFKMRREQAERKRNRRIQLLSTDSTLLIVEYVRCAITTIIFAMTFTASLTLFIIIKSLTSEYVRWAYMVGFIIFGVLTLWMEVLSLNILKVCRKARRKYILLLNSKKEV